MRNERSSSWSPDDATIERTVVLLVLVREQDVRWSFAELLAEITDVEPERVREAVWRLARQGLLHVHEELIIASRQAHHLDRLDMICI
jgi:hypothetical protein